MNDVPSKRDGSDHIHICMVGTAGIVEIYSVSIGTTSMSRVTFFYYR
jgi:hypothetical protein